MSAENVEIVRRMNDAWNSRDLEATLALADPDVEYVNSPTAVEPGNEARPRGTYDRASGAVGRC